MDQALVDVFEQARKVVADADRRSQKRGAAAEESERESLLLQLGARLEDTFRLHQQGKAGVATRLMFRMVLESLSLSSEASEPSFCSYQWESNMWTLQMVDDGHKPQVLSELQGGTKLRTGIPAVWQRHARGGGRQLGSKRQGPQAVPNTKQSSRSHDRDEPKPELTYGTMGKFLGY